MNRVILCGRLTRDPYVTTAQGSEPMTVAKYTLAVDRIRRKDTEQEADFISCVAFGRVGDFARDYLHKGTKVIVEGRIQTGSYTNREGQKVYTTDVVVERHEFAESKAGNSGNGGNGDGNGYQGGSQQGAGYQQGGSQQQFQPQYAASPSSDPSGFMDIPPGIDDELPFM